MSLNRVTISGRLSKDLELRRTQSDTAAANFTLAVDGDFKDKQTGERPTYWIDCVAWGAAAEFMARYISKKGRMVVLDGRLQSCTWQDKHGNNRKSVAVVAEHIYFGDSKRNESEKQDGYSNGSGSYAAPVPSDGDQFSELSDDGGELPF